MFFKIKYEWLDVENYVCRSSHPSVVWKKLFWIFWTEAFHESIHVEAFLVGLEVPPGHLPSRLFHWCFCRNFPNLRNSCAVVEYFWKAVCTLRVVWVSNYISWNHASLFLEAAIYSYSYERLFWKCASNLQENKHAAVLLCSFIEIILRAGCSPAILLHILRTPSPQWYSNWSIQIVSIN